MTGELDPRRLNLHTKMRSGGNGMWGRGPAQRKQSLKKNIRKSFSVRKKADKQAVRHKII